MMHTRLWFVGLSLATLLCASTKALAADYYFDSVLGDDTLDGKTEVTAKKTFKMPTGTGNTVYLKRGSTWTGNLQANNVTVKAYGTGERPVFNGSVSLSKSTVEGIRFLPTTGNGANLQGDSILQDCDIDGTNDTSSAVGVGVMGQNNKVLGNIVREFHVSQSGTSMDSSGGAEGIMVMASNNEVAWNTMSALESPNATLNGFEGGCMEIVNGKALSTISNVSFHHNYCEYSIGLWEGCSGDFSPSGGNIQENHAIIENVTISYNVSVDSMWLFLLQPVNTDFKNVVFDHNTLIHTPKTMEWFDASHTSMGLAVATYTNGATGIKYDTDNAFYKKSGGFQPGTIIMRNNIFIDDISPTTRYMMFSTNLTDHSNNIFVPAKASVGSITLDATEKKIDLSALALSPDYRLTAASTPAIDQGAVVGMTGNGTLAGSALIPSFFESVFNQDIDKHQAPCGSAPDIGASEYCEGAGGSSGFGGSTGVGGAVGSGGASSPASSGAGGAQGPGGAGGETTDPTTGGGSKGCSCNLGGRSPTSPNLNLLAAALLLGLFFILDRSRTHREKRP